MDDDSSKPKSYGPIKIGGRRNFVQLGDSQTTNTYNVGSVNLPLPEEVLVFLADAVAKTARSSLSPRSQVNGQRRLKSALLYKKKVIVKRKRCCPSKDQGQPDAVALSDKQRVLQTVLEIIHKWMSRMPTPTIPFNLALSAWTDGCAVSDKHHIETDLSECFGALNETHSERAVVVRDHSFMGAVLVSWMFGKHITAQNLLGFLHKCSQDDLLPVLLLVLCAGLYRYYTMRTIPRSPCQLFWTLEDAYGFPRQLSMDLLVDFTVLQKFLHVHYREAKRTTGAHLIRVGQFHMMLGSRRGLVMGSTNWSEVSAAIKPGRRVINAVYVTSPDQTCLNCKAVLTVTGSGEFHCENCGTFHRDYSTFNLPTKETSSYRSSSPSLVPEPQATNLPPTPTPAIGWVTDRVPGRIPPPVEVLHDYEDIKNLDLRIIPCLPLHLEGSNVEEVLAVYPCHRLPTGVDLTNSTILHFYVRLQRFKRRSDGDSLLLSELPLQYGATTTFRNADGQTALRIPFLPHGRAIELLADMLGLKTVWDRGDGLMHLLVTHKSQAQDDSDPIEAGQPSDPRMPGREKIHRNPGEGRLWQGLAAPYRAELLDIIRNNRRHRNPAVRSLLSQALAAANQAVLLDNAENVPEAIDAYRNVCDLLEQVKTSISRVDDRKKLDAISHSYYQRISELLTFKSLVDGHTDGSLDL